MSALADSFFNVEIVAAYWPLLLRGLGMTLLLSALSIPLGFGGGLLLGWLDTLGSRAVTRTTGLYVDLFRSFPPLVLLVLIFYGLPFFGLDLPTLASVLLAFFLNTSSYYGEIVRAGLGAVPSGQWDGARALGLSHTKSFAWSCCRKRCAMSPPTSPATRWKWSSSPRWPAWSRCPN